MADVEYEPTHKMNVFNPDMKTNDSIFIKNLKKRLSHFNSETKFEIKNLLNSSR